MPKTYTSRIVPLLIILFMIAACQPKMDAEEAARAKAFQQLTTNFKSLSLPSGDALSCSDMRFGPEASDGSDVLQLAYLQAAIPKNLLKQEGFWNNQTDKFDSLSSYFGLGQIALSPTKTGLIIGRHLHEKNRSTHLFVFDTTQHSFIGAQSLNFTLEGNNFKAQRDAWLKDLNSDGMPDVIYNFSAAFDSDNPELNYEIRDSLHAEIWSDNAFATMPLSDPAAVRSDLGIQMSDPAPEVQGSGVDEFF